MHSRIAQVASDARAAQTLSRHLAGAHHYLRRRVPGYDQWHRQPYTHQIHWLVLMVAGLIQVVVISQAVRGAGFGGGDIDGGGGAAPTVALITQPSPNSRYRAVTMPLVISGQAADDPSGQGLAADSASFRLERLSDGSYWTGTEWGFATDLATSHTLAAAGALVDWQSSGTLPAWQNGSYRLQATTRNLGGQTLVGDGVTFSYDATPPTAPGQVSDGQDATDDLFSSLTDQLTVNWTASQDVETGVVGYQSAVGTSAGQTDVRTWSDTASGLSATISGLTLASGTTYFVSVRAVDAAGNVSSATSSSGVVIDTMPPNPIISIADGRDASDDLWSQLTSELSANWSATTDSLSGLAGYQYALGTSVGGTQLRSWNDAGLVTSLTATGLTLLDGTRYYVSVRPRDQVGNLGQITTSNGLLIDQTAPLAPTISVPAASSNQLPTITWTDLTDPSGIASVTLTLGTSAGGSDILSASVSPSATGFTPAAPLPVGSYYLGLVITDGAGNQRTVEVNQPVVIEAAPPSPTTPAATMTAEPTLTPSISPTLEVTSATPTPKLTASEPALTESVATSPSPAASPPAETMLARQLTILPTAAPLAEIPTLVAGEQAIRDGLAWLVAIDHLPAFQGFAQAIYLSTALILLFGLFVPVLLNLPLLFPLDYLLVRFIPPLWRRRRYRIWGRVYDAESLKPVPLATVRVYEANRPRLVETVTTDREGNFGLEKRSGQYRLQVQKDNYQFPSGLIANDYHGALVTFRKEPSDRFAIPIDPIHQRLRAQLQVLAVTQDLVTSTRRPLLVIGMLLALLGLFSDHSIFTGLMVFSYSLVWVELGLERLVSRRLTGRVLDHQGQTLSMAILRFFNQASGRLVATAVTNRLGGFSVRLPLGYYRVRMTQVDHRQSIAEEVITIHDQDTIREYRLKKTAPKGIR